MLEIWLCCILCAVTHPFPVRYSNQQQIQKSSCCPSFPVFLKILKAPTQAFHWVRRIVIAFFKISCSVCLIFSCTVFIDCDGLHRRTNEDLPSCNRANFWLSGHKVLGEMSSNQQILETVYWKVKIFMGENDQGHSAATTTVCWNPKPME